MADWYVSSATYAAVTAFAASTAYTVGQLVKPTAPAIGAQYVFRCTTAGTSSTEPTWPSANNATITTGGATFTNVSGQSTYGWSAAAGNLFCLVTTQSAISRPQAADRVFLSSDHSEAPTSGFYGVGGTTGAFGLIQIISVNRAGSVPPVATDVQNGAAISSSSASGLGLDAYCDLFWQGITFTASATSGTAHIYFGEGTGGVFKGHYLKNCALKITGTNVGQRITSLNGGTKIILDNTTIQFAATGQSIGSGSGVSFDVIWINTSSAIPGATIPATLFLPGVQGCGVFATCRGVDLSAVTGTFVGFNSTGGGVVKLLLASCKIASGVTRLNTSPNTTQGTIDEVELVNCYDGTSVLNERYTIAGAVTTDRSTTLSGGAQDDTGNYSLKLVSSTRSDKSTFPLDCFWFDVENTLIGSSKTATVEIISSATLNNDDISLLLEYMGTSGSSIASVVSSLPATVLTTGSALTSSSVSWNNPPSTPQKQKLQVTFTPQVVGRVRGLVRLGKTSTTVWVNPQITIT
jgi:hypothetical protein